ncbi:MAG TPA: hypothetical protein H9761_12575 [Candidatus Eisenbergiella merdavium]|uniref:Uncharacterized protein n=1 Tax=Candidatus Eisenbergiella merdavium TaxID=2838551 RepID=A0A9D2NG27_9FIRM|nr:hypothetical protein [Candidatus Eisenbergiella merdavium]
MEFLIAIGVVIFLMWKFFAFRAFMIFQTTFFSPVVILVGVYFLLNEEFRLAGVIFLVIGILLGLGSFAMFYFTGKKLPKEKRKPYYKALFLYGAVLFIRILSIGLLVGIFFFKFFEEFGKDYREAALESGRTVVVDSSLRDPYGKQYERVKK